MLAVFVQALLALVIVYFACYVLLELRTARLSGQQEKIPLVGVEAGSGVSQTELLPVVSVLLPVYNERFVVEKLIDAVCALKYPAEKLDILVLDDSSDETTRLAHNRIYAHAMRGVPIRHARRSQRIGYKAGNLNFGLALARGEFIAIFDADFLPPPDFLLRTIPCFYDAQVGFLQTGISYANQDACFLTKFQAMEAGHKQYITVGLAQDGLMASLTGSSCVWRRACIEDIGGISAETITEDVDMGYKAQLHKWKYAFLRNIVSQAELPVTMGAFRVQRERWARGLVHNALLHVQNMFSTPMPLLQRLHALSLMFSSLLLASFFVLLLLSLPISLLTNSFGLFFTISCSAFLLAAIAWAYCNFRGSQKEIQSNAKPEPVWQQVLRTYAYVALFFPLSLYYFCAALQVFTGVNGRFNRTPKGHGQKKIEYPYVNRVLLCLEAVSFLYVFVALVCSIIFQNYWVTLFTCIASSGFGITLYLSLQEWRHWRCIR